MQYISLGSVYMNSNKLPVGSYLAVGLSYNNTDDFDENALVYSCTPAGDNWSVYQGYGVGNGGPIQCDKRGTYGTSV